VAGIKGSKPRFKSAREELPSLNRVYLESRNAKLKAQAFLAEAQAKEKAGELISRELVARQAQFIFICLRQAILNFPTKYARRVVGIVDEHQSKAVLTKAAHEFLTELADFPNKAIDPNWLQSVDDDDHPGQPIRPASGQQIRAEQERAKRRRAKKAATMRKFGAEGRAS
jgi:hypothetical protein